MPLDKQFTVLYLRDETVKIYQSLEALIADKFTKPDDWHTNVFNPAPLTVERIQYMIAEREYALVYYKTEMAPTYKIQEHY